MTDLDLTVLGHRIRHARRQAGRTLADLSALVGRPVPYLSQLENGKVEPKLGLIAEVADALGTTATALLGSALGIPKGAVPVSPGATP